LGIKNNIKKVINEKIKLIIPMLKNNLGEPKKAIILVSYFPKRCNIEIKNTVIIISKMYGNLLNLMRTNNESLTI
jgi:hypothetical protein